MLASDGYILAILGFYFSDSRSNDAQILNNEFQRDADNMREWFHDGDIFILNRGYQNAQQLLRELALSIKCQPFLEPQQK